MLSLVVFVTYYNIYLFLVDVEVDYVNVKVATCFGTKTFLILFQSLMECSY